MTFTSNRLPDFPGRLFGTQIHFITISLHHLHQPTAFGPVMPRRSVRCFAFAAPKLGFSLICPGGTSWHRWPHKNKAEGSLLRRGRLTVAQGLTWSIPKGGRLPRALVNNFLNQPLMGRRSAPIGYAGVLQRGLIRVFASTLRC